MILGAIIGDIIGIPYEFTRNRMRSKDFPLFQQRCRVSDDSVMTVANMEWLMGRDLVSAMRDLANRYPKAGYGGMFRKWINDTKMGPYNSLGNGSAMRVSPVAWVAKDLDECRRLARRSAEVTHNHPEGIKGAEAVASAIWMAKHKAPKAVIKNYIEENFGYDLDTTVDKIREDYTFDATCPGSVPQAIRCFLEGESYEDTVRNAVSLGGDTDTQAAIAGGIAEAYYGIPQDIINRALKFIPDDLLNSIKQFSEKYGN